MHLCNWENFWKPLDKFHSHWTAHPNQSGTGSDRLRPFLSASPTPAIRYLSRSTWPKHNLNVVGKTINSIGNSKEEWKLWDQLGKGVVPVNEGWSLQLGVRSGHTTEGSQKREQKSFTLSWSLPCSLLKSPVTHLLSLRQVYTNAVEQKAEHSSSCSNSGVYCFTLSRWCLWSVACSEDILLCCA